MLSLYGCTPAFSPSSAKPRNILRRTSWVCKFTTTTRARLMDVERMRKSGLLNSQSLPSAFTKITEAQQTVDACFSRIGVQGATFTLLHYHHLPSQCSLSRPAHFDASLLSSPRPLRVGMATCKGLEATSIVHLCPLAVPQFSQS